MRHEGAALGGLADTLISQGRLEEAAARYDELLELQRSVGNGFSIAVASQKAAALALMRHEEGRAATLLAQAHPLVRDAGSRVLAWDWCRLVGLLAARRRRWVGAVQLLASASRNRAGDGLRPGPDDVRSEQAGLDASRTALGESAYEQARAAGAAHTDAQALDLATTELAAQP